MATSYQSKSKNTPTGQLPKQVRDRMEADRLAIINKAKLIKARKEDKAASSTPLKPMGSYVKPGTKPDRDRKAQANRAKSQGGRSFAQAGATKAGLTLARAAKTKRDITAKITAAEKKSKDPRGNQVKATPGKAKSATNYNVGVSKGGVSFKEAFKHFRSKGQSTFTWNGKKYTTDVAKAKPKAKVSTPTPADFTMTGKKAAPKFKDPRTGFASKATPGKAKGALPAGALRTFTSGRGYNNKTEVLRKVDGKTYVFKKGK